MKKFFCLMIIFLTSLNIAYAEKKLRVGYVPQTGFLEEDRSGHIRGYGYEYMEFLARYGDWKFEYVPSTSWQECNQKLQAGVIDVLPAMPGDYRSLQNVTRTDHVIGRYAMELVTQDGTVKQNMRIGTTSSNPPTPSLPKIANAEGFTYELINYPLFFDMEEAFNRKELDGYITPMFEPSKEKNVVSIFDRQSYRLLVRSDRKDLLDAMNIAMDEMLMDQPNIRNRLNDKYLRSGGSPLILNRYEKNYLLEKGKLTTAILTKQKPYAYYESGTLKGVIPSLLNQISADLNIEIEIVETDSSAETMNLIQRGMIDFVADAVCDFSWARTLNMAPTQSYLMLDYVPIVRRGSSLEEINLVACATEELYTKNFVYPRYDEDKRVLLPTLKDCFVAVNDGQADILFAPRNEVEYLIEETGSYNLEVASESVFSEEISLGVSTDADYKLWRILNKEINHLDLAKVRDTVNAGMNSATHFSLQWQLYHHPFRVLGVLFLILTIIAATVGYRYYLRRRHLNFVQHMAYTDSRYQLPNLSWLKDETPKIFSQFIDTDDILYVVAFKSETGVGNTLVYENNLQGSQIKNMAAHLGQTDWAILVSTGNDKNSLVCVGKAQNSSEISRLALDVAKKSGYIEMNDAKIWLQTKIGICKIDRMNFKKSIENAQIACKKSQKDVLVFDSQFRDSLDFEKQIQEKMFDALKNGEFQAWYQTEYDIKNHKSTGAEAFVRWQSSELGFLLPDKFLPLFERNGFIIQVDYFILEEVCKFQRKRLDDKKEIFPIAINQSGLHITEEDYLEKTRKIIEKYKLPKNILKIEFNEKTFEGLFKNDQEKKVVSIMKALQKMGFIISIDDFGSGYSSYKLINNLPINEMKIDKSILYASNSSERMREILGNIIQLGNKMKVKVICEGVETKEQENFLLKLGCKFGQGFVNSEIVAEPDFVS